MYLLLLVEPEMLRWEPHLCPLSANVEPSSWPILSIRLLNFVTVVSGESYPSVPGAVPGQLDQEETGRVSSSLPFSWLPKDAAPSVGSCQFSSPSFRVCPSTHDDAGFLSIRVVVETIHDEKGVHLLFRGRTKTSGRVIKQ